MNVKQRGNGFRVAMLLMILLSLSMATLSHYIPSVEASTTTTIYSSIADGRVHSSGKATWAAARDASLGTSVDTTDEYNSWMVRGDIFGGLYNVHRSFFYFNTSGIPSGATITATTLQIYGCVTAQDNVTAYEGTQNTTLGTADFDNFTGLPLGDPTTSWSITGYNTITFNQTGLDAINKTGTTKVCLRNYEHDVLNVVPTAQHTTGGYYADKTGTSYDPKLVVTWKIAPVNQALSISDMDDTDNLYAQRKWYSLNYNVSDQNGYADIDYAEVTLNTTVTETFFSTSADGLVGIEKQTTWTKARDNTTGDFFGHTASSHFLTMSSDKNIDTTYDVYRSFFYFDTSSIPDTAVILSVDLSLRGWAFGESSVTCMKGTQSNTLVATDLDAFTGSEYGHTSSWSTTGYNTISFNAQGKTDINKTGTTKICAREYNHDYLNVAPTTSAYNGVYYSEYSGTSFDPKIVVSYNVTETTTFRFDEDTDTFSIQSGTTFDLNTTSSSATKSGNNLNMTFKFSPRWNATEGKLTFTCYVVDVDGLTDTDVMQTDYAAVVTTLTVGGFSCDDDRGDPEQTLAFSGTVYYVDDPASSTASSFYPPDSEFNNVTVRDSSNNDKVTDTSIVNGAFSGSFTASSSIESVTYHPYVDMADSSYTDNDITTITDSFISDRLDFDSITASEYTVEVEATFYLYYQISYSYDDVTFDSTKGSITGFVWDTSNLAWQKEVKAASEAKTTNYDETYVTLTDSTYGITEKQDVAGVSVTTEGGGGGGGGGGPSPEPEEPTIPEEPTPIQPTPVIPSITPPPSRPDYIIPLGIVVIVVLVGGAYLYKDIQKKSRLIWPSKKRDNPKWPTRSGFTVDWTKKKGVTVNWSQKRRKSPKWKKRRSLDELD